MTELSFGGHLQVIRAALASTRAMRILVIEDEARILSFLSRGLEAEGYTVEGAADGSDGLERAVEGRWDMILLDLMLPGLDGLDVLEALHRKRPEVPVADPVRPSRPAHEAQGLRSRRQRLRREALRARGAARAYPRTAATHPNAR